MTYFRERKINGKYQKGIIIKSNTRVVKAISLGQSKIQTQDTTHDG
jgi:hypothetical protein